jgi:hypothetical protein
MINYNILAHSIEYYYDQGFERIESPWTVTKAISDITKPEHGTDWTIREKNKVLVASAEQSFLYLYNKGFLPHGMFQSITPCFRDEPFDELHSKYFMKNELIVTGACVDDALVQKIARISLGFFNQYLPGCEIVECKTIGKSYDIMYKDVELGSYGLRECSFLKWIYGTGVAEPRLTRTIKKYGIPLKENTER